MPQAMKLPALLTQTRSSEGALVPSHCRITDNISAVKAAFDFTKSVTSCSGRYNDQPVKIAPTAILESISILSKYAACESPEQVPIFSTRDNQPLTASHPSRHQ
jgi:hypothetical protein